MARFLIKIIALLPFALRSNLGAKVGYLIGLWPNRQQQICRKQIQVILGRHDFVNLSNQVYGNLGRNFAEAIELTSFLENHNQNIELDDPDQCTRLCINPAQPVIVLSAHIGNWDLMAAYFVKLGIPVTTIARVAKKAWQQDLLEEVRNNYGIYTIWRNSKLEERRQIIKQFRENKVLAVLLDQDLNLPGVASQFFGRFVKVSDQLIALGLEYNAKFISCLNYRTTSGKFIIEMRKINADLDRIKIIEEYHCHLESIIRKVPDQWVWVHKRWRSPSLDYTMSSMEYLKYLQN